MEKYINIIEITDPLAKDFGFIHKKVPFVQGKLLSEYLKENYDNLDLICVYLNLCEVESFELELKESDTLLLSYDMGYMAIPFIAAAITEFLSATAIGVYLSVAALEIIGTIAAYAIVGGFLYLASSLLAPDVPSAGTPKGIDQSKAYQWGDVSNTSRQMIPIPPCFGRFKISGNLIAARTESYNYNKAGYSIRETLYLLYSLSSTQLHQINGITINGMEASTIHEDDISIYYTEGTNTQLPINPEYSLSYLPDDPIAPAGTGPLFPDLGIEKLLNKELDIPNHMVTITSSTEKLVSYVPAQVAVPNSYNDDDSMGAVTGLPFIEDVSAYSSDSSSLLWFSGYLLETIDSESSDCLIKVFPEISGKTLDELTRPPYPIFIKIYIKTYDETVLTSESTEYIFIHNLEIDDEDNNILKATFDISIGRPTPKRWEVPEENSHLPIDLNQVIAIKAIAKYEVIYDYTPAQIGDPQAKWEPAHYVPSNSWTTYTSDSQNIENLILQFVMPKGMYSQYSGSHSGKDAGVKFGRWESYELIVEQLNEYGNPIADVHFTPPDITGSLTTIMGYYNSNAPCPQAFYVAGSFPNAHEFSFTAIDIVRERTNYPELYTTDTGTYLNLDPVSGFLPKGFQYNFKVRIHGHGNYGRGPVIGFTTVDPNITGKSKVTDIYETRLYRVTEIDYDETLSYPNNVLLGVALNSTPTVSGQMPVIVADCEFKITYPMWDSQTEKYQWVTKFSNNPAHIALAICYDNLWGAGIASKEDFHKYIDLDSFREFADFCDRDHQFDITDPTSIDKNYTFNGIFDSRISVWDAITKVCLVANGSPYFENGKISVYWEDDILSPVQLFSNTNIKEGTFTLTYMNKSDTAHAVSGSYIDIESGEKTEITWMLPLSNPSKNVAVELFGVTEYKRAVRAVQYKLNKTNALKVTCNFITTLAALNCQVGDLVIVQNEFIDWGNPDYAGLINNIQNNTEITLDRKIPEPQGVKYILIRLNSNDTLFSVKVLTWDNSGKLTKLDVEYTNELQDIEFLDPFVIGVGVDAYKKFVIGSIDINNSLECSISAVEYLEQSQIDTNIFLVSDLINKKLTKEMLCPRFISFEVDLALQNVVISFSPPTITTKAQGDDKVPILRYQIWRRKGQLGDKINDKGSAWQLIGETVDPEYTDYKLSVGFRYFYKVIPIFSYFGAEATMPLSWCVNFKDGIDEHGNPIWVNPELDEGVDLVWSVYDYLPYPRVIRSEFTKGVITPSLRDYTFYTEDPKNWETKDASEAFGIWWKVDTETTNRHWLGPTNITLVGDIDSGAQYMTVSSTGGLTIPGLVIIGHTDLVYVHQAIGNQLLIGHPTKCDHADLTRKFVVGINHYNGEPVYNAHKGFFPVKYFGFRDDVKIVTEKNQLYCETIYEFTLPAEQIVEGSLKHVVTLGSGMHLPVFGRDNTVTSLTQVTANSFITPFYTPVMDDFTINPATLDIYGDPTYVNVAVWNPKTQQIAPILKNNKDELFFSVVNLPPDGYLWLSVCRYKFNVAIDEQRDTYGWVSHIFPYEE